MAGREMVTFTLETGARVTAPREVAERLGWKPKPEPKPRRTSK